MDELTACRRAIELTRQMKTDLLESHGDQQAVAAIEDVHRDRWRELHETRLVLGVPHPLWEFPSAWDWFSRCGSDLSDPGGQVAYLDALTQEPIAELEARESRLESGAPQAPFRSHYYRDARGRAPVVDYMDELRDPDTAARLRSRIGFLNDLTREHPFLGRPHGAALGGTADGFYELRVNTNAQHRIIYAPFGNLFILLHAFQKPGSEVPEPEKVIARNNWNDFLNRQGTKPDPLGERAP
jgi:phage-related protein